MAIQCFPQCTSQLRLQWCSAVLIGEQGFLCYFLYFRLCQERCIDFGGDVFGHLQDIMLLRAELFLFLPMKRAYSSIMRYTRTISTHLEYYPFLTPHREQRFSRVSLANYDFVF